MKNYHNLLSKILSKGQLIQNDRTGTGTYSLFGEKLVYDLQEGFPLVTTKKINFNVVAGELLWFISGSTNVNDLNSKIWDEWCSTEDTVLFKKISPKISAYSVGDINKKNPTTSITIDKSINSKLRSIWNKMLDRCYNPSAHNYKYYGAKGITVCSRWMSLETFIIDVKTLTNWELKKDNWNTFELDKDYYGSKIYAPDVCLWLTSSENNKITKQSIIITKTSGRKELFRCIQDVCDTYSVTKSCVHRFLNGQDMSKLSYMNKRFSNWRFEYSTDLVRKEVVPKGSIGPMYGAQFRDWARNEDYYIDQIADLIHNIKNNPNSRRHILTSLNLSDVPDESKSPQENIANGKGALWPCHSLPVQFYVRGEYLDCQMYQRSADAFLGLPFNIASTSLLTHMVAQICGYKVGTYTHILGDVHIYLNHVDQVNTLLQRTPKKLPTLVLNQDIKSIFDFKLEDISLSGYEPYGTIKAPISV